MMFGWLKKWFGGHESTQRENQQQVEDAMLGPVTMLRTMDEQRTREAAKQEQRERDIAWGRAHGERQREAEKAREQQSRTVIRDMASQRAANQARPAASPPAASVSARREDSSSSVSESPASLMYGGWSPTSDWSSHSSSASCSDSSSSSSDSGSSDSGGSCGGTD